MSPVTADWYQFGIQTKVLRQDPGRREFGNGQGGGLARCALGITHPERKALSAAAVVYLIIFLCFDSSVPGDQYFALTFFFYSVMCAEP